LRKRRVKGFCGIFTNPKLVITTVFLTAIVCILSYIVGMSYANANSRITLLNATVAGTDTLIRPTLSEPGTKAGPEQARPNSPAYDHFVNSEGVIKRNTNPPGTSGQSGEWETIQMRVTAYCPCRKCCGIFSDGVTACGHKIRPGDSFVAADKRYPFGAEMIIPGYKNGEPVKVLDRGGAIRGNRLDVFFNSHKEALKWGVKNLNVKVHRK